MLRIGAMAMIAAIGISGRDVAAKPHPGDLVDVVAAIPDAVIDIRYATNDNFTGRALYPRARCVLRRGVVARLVVAANILRKQDRRLLLWDCYRPLSIQRTLWKLVPDPRYVADPKTGSNHNRGAAIDLAIVDNTGAAVALPTKFDEFSAAAHRARALAGGTGREAQRLADAMVAAGFVGLATEWWHFDAPDGADYALADDPL